MEKRLFKITAILMTLILLFNISVSDADDRSGGIVYAVGALSKGIRLSIPKKSYKHTGKVIKPTVTVKYNGKKLSKKNYTVKYQVKRNGKWKAVAKPKKVGTYRILVTLKGKVKNKSVKGKKKSIVYKITKAKQTTTQQPTSTDPGKTTTTTPQDTTQNDTTEDVVVIDDTSGCKHKWVVDEKAHYEWYNLYDKDGSIITDHLICPGCGIDLSEYAIKINNQDLGTLLKTHPCIAGNIFGSASEQYVHYGKDSNGNWIDHPHRGQSVGMDTYIPATYKCGKCGAKIYINPINNNLKINIHKLQKEGSNIDISNLAWIYEGTNYDGEGKKEVSIIINGKTIKCSSFYDMD